ncbi:TetR/AcrR family transcriptional regulator [Modestobacter sp. SSW1-42]|uniref:TetR/AcrR family transcriptional regulator n=1 Tax=Modestobacter sp. SSW1-42 TaxID=596372 RepID=UPI0039870BA7
MPDPFSRWSDQDHGADDEDPRVQRTRQHVLQTARALLAEGGPAALTHTALSARARVSRQTLYRYWPTPENLVADMVRRRVATVPEEPAADVEAVVRDYVRSLAAAFTDRSVHGAYAMLIATAATDEDVAAVLRDVIEQRRVALNDQLAPWGCSVSAAQFALVVGPVVHLAFVAHSPLGDDVVDMVVRDAVRRLAG